MSEPFDVVVIGAGQAGLAASRGLTARGIAHVVLERAASARRGRGRWDSLCLVTPNWSIQLSARPYDGDDPDGFMAREEIVGYLERYRADAEAPVVEGAEVTSLTPASRRRFPASRRRSGRSRRAR